MEIKHNKTTRSKLNGVAAGIWLTAAAINGGIALDAHNEVGREQAVAEISEEQGDSLQALEHREIADGFETRRNINVGLVATNLGVAAMSGAFAVSAIRRERE